MSQDGEPPMLSRRLLLGYGGVAGLMLGMPGEPGRRVAATGSASELPISFTAKVFRREDQLALTLDGVNLKLLKAGDSGPGPIGAARLARVVPTDPETYLIVKFGPQSLAEHAYQEPGDDGTLTTPTFATPVGESRLVFKVPPTVGSIPYTLAGLLAWGQLMPSVAPNAVRAVSGKPEPKAPTQTETSLELPYRVLLSPHDGSGWAHTVTPPPDPRIELWHTRLGLRIPGGVDEQNTDQRTVRAVWTPNFQKTVPPDSNALDPAPLGLTSLTPRHRYEIVRLSSDYTIVDDRDGPYLPQPFQVDRLMLSSLGAWLHGRADWPATVYPTDLSHLQDKGLTAASWIHRAAMGRDHYVRVVDAGFFLPTGHPAALITIAERKFQGVGLVRQGDPRAGRPAAFLRKRMFLVPRGGWRRYDPAVDFLPHDGRGMPFKKVRITTVITPNLVVPDGQHPNARVPKDLEDLSQGYHGTNAFWPMVPMPNGDEDFRFAVEAIDAENRMSTFSLPLVFVKGNISNTQDLMENLVTYYNTDETRPRRTAELNGQRVALASYPDGTAGEAAYPLSSFTFGADNPEPQPGQLPNPKTQPLFFPTMATADVRLDAVERVRGGTPFPNAHPVTLHDAWLSTPDNPARVFATLDEPVDLAFAADASGGVLAPNLKITGLSARTGPVGGELTEEALAAFRPATFFAGAEPKLLGGVSLLDVLAEAAPFDTTGKAPRLVTTEVPGGIESSLTWRPELKDSPVFVPQPSAALVLTASSLAKLDGSPPVTEVSGDISNFHLIAVGELHLATVKFRRLRFVSVNGKKPDVDADITGVDFHGVLAFVNDLQQFLKSIGVAQSGNQLTASDSDPQAGGGFVDVTKDGIKIGETLSVPSVPLGVFLLENISLTSEIDIPFQGDPARVRFSFASREKPFHVTVAMFGGGGFCGVHFGLDEFEQFEASLEFGAKLALDIGVASGSVSVLAGVYLAIGPDDGELTGFVRINGELEIIEIVSMNIEFYLGLTYTFANNEVWGEASVTVEIDVLIFSGSVKLGPIRKRFAGGSQPPPPDGQALRSRAALTAVAAPPATFADLMPQPADWQEYCQLFAAAAFA